MEKLNHLTQASEAAANSKMMYGGGVTAITGGSLSFSANLELIQSVLGIIAIVIGIVFTIWGFVRQGKHQKKLEKIAQENKRLDKDEN